MACHSNESFGEVDLGRKWKQMSLSKAHKGAIFICAMHKEEGKAANWIRASRLIRTSCKNTPLNETIQMQGEMSLGWKVAFMNWSVHCGMLFSHSAMHSSRKILDNKTKKVLHLKKYILLSVCEV